MMKLFAGGPKAQSEALRMVTEKTTALAEATMTLARGGVGAEGHAKISNPRQIEPATFVEILSL